MTHIMVAFLYEWNYVTEGSFVLNKKIIGIIVAYTLIMASLLSATFIAQWTPSGYDYSVEGETLTIEQGVFTKTATEVNIEEQQVEALRFYVALSGEREQWRVDVTAIGLLLPFLLLLVVPDRRPFQKFLSFKWYATIFVGVAVIYLAISIPAHLAHISEIHEYVNRLLE